MTRFTRRGFLKASTTAGAAMLPLVPILESDAAVSGFPKRLILFYQPLGTHLPSWRPTGGVEDFTLSPILNPLQAHRDKLLILDGIDNMAIRLGPGKGGHPAISCLWTGRPHAVGDFVAPTKEGFGWPQGPSVDQYIAKRIAETESYPFRSVELGVDCSSDPQVWRLRMSFAGADQPVPHQDDPRQAFKKLFADSLVDPATLARLRAMRLSVVDNLGSELKTMRARIPAADREKLDSHIQSLQSIEERLSSSAVCEQFPPEPAASMGVPARFKIQIDMLVAAMKCGMTRVGSLLLGKEFYGLGTHTWLGHTQTSHGLSHLNTANGHTAMREISRFYAENFAYLLDQLQATPEGDGTMLDNTVVVWASPLGNTFGHSLRNVPVVMAGSCGGYFNTGRYLKFGNFPATSGSNDDHGGRSMNDLLITLCHAMGFEDVETFGTESLCSGPMAELI